MSDPQSGMPQTLKAEGGTTFSYTAADFSGGVRIVTAAGEGMTIPFADLREFVNRTRWKLDAQGRREPGLSHGTLTKYARGCRCEPCTGAARADRNRAKKVNSETITTAINHGKQWTGPEMEIAARADLTAREAAKVLGRSLKGVKGMRARLTQDPRYRDTAGALPGAPRVIGS